MSSRPHDVSNQLTKETNTLLIIIAQKHKKELQPITLSDQS